LRIELWNAVMTFEDNYGIPFMSYASNCLKKRYKSWVRQHFYRRKSMLERSSTSLDIASPYVMRIAEPLDDFADVIWRKSVRVALNNFIQNQLTDLERQVFTLWYADYSYKEICEYTGRHQKAVDNALSRVKKKLRNSCVLREYWADLQA
jgi:RNA polymerase sigma factor (sigma-70 family)